jgi:hypothetical protein
MTTTTPAQNAPRSSALTGVRIGIRRPAFRLCNLVYLVPVPRRAYPPLHQPPKDGCTDKYCRHDKIPPVHLYSARQCGEHLHPVAFRLRKHCITTRKPSDTTFCA